MAKNIQEASYREINDTEKGLVPVQESQRNTAALQVYDVAPEKARHSLQVIKQFQSVVKKEMVSGHDYGVIPGTDRPTLLKPGAEKLAKLLGCADEYETIKEIEEWDKPFFYYQIKCRLVSMASGVTISEGLGSANSYEAKWRYRWVFSSEIPDNVDKTTLQKRERKSKKGTKYVTYRMENEDIYSQVNTILKIAKKRALVDAALSAGRLSDIFTQDIEDIPPEDISQETTTESFGNPIEEDPQEEVKKLLIELGVNQDVFLVSLCEKHEVKDIPQITESQWKETSRHLNSYMKGIDNLAFTWESSRSDIVAFLKGKFGDDVGKAYREVYQAVMKNNGEKEALKGEFNEWNKAEPATDSKEPEIEMDPKDGDLPGMNKGQKRPHNPPA